jgi:hypothetical protein
MNRLFLFCIGGTGSRVLKALVYMLASGVKFPVRELIPIIIDPDKDNGDVEQIIRLLNYYQNIRNQIDPDKSDFFKVKIERLSNITDGDVADISQEFRTDIASKGTSGETFKNFIGYNTLDNETKAFMQLLYNEQTNLESDLTVGFKGNPHMGSIVLNRFQSSADFKAFVNKLTDDDGVFIVSSIFGGTGAAGFPLLVKNIREPHANYIGKAGVMKQVPLGALTVLPYFGVEKKDGSAISKDTFINKTKAALSFYGSDLNGINALYYVGDDLHKDYANHEGGRHQRNDAHFIEMVSALAVIDFAHKNKNDMKTTTEGVAISPSFKEFGILIPAENERYALDFMNLGAQTRELLGPSLIKFFYAIQFWKNQLANSLNNPKQPFVNGKVGIRLPETLLNSPFFSDNLTPLYQGFETWLKEIGRNVRTFKPFNFDSNELEEMIQNLVQESKGIWPMKTPKWDYKNFEDALNEAEPQTAGLNVEQKLMAIFTLATQKIYDERIKSALLG